MISREHTGTDRSGADTGTEVRSEGWLQRMERARQARNHREMAQLLLDGADTALADAGDAESLERVQWLLARAQRSLDACATDPAYLTLLCALMERQWQLAQHWQPLDHPGQRHATREQVRDLAFEVARHGERSEDLGQRVSVILRAAEALEALGDQSDAHTLRARACHRLGAASLRETSLPCRAATSYQ